MKKITSLLLALCMLLAITPALAEEGPGGNWYMTLADVTLGYFFLNEDGSAVVNMMDDEDTKGTWACSENTVTITIDGQDLNFAYDGASLSTEEFPIALTREEGKLSFAQLDSYMGGEETALPEGMTEPEMMSIAMNFLTEYQNIMEAQTAGIAGGAAPSGNAEVTILKENFKIVKSYSGYNGLYIAKIQNQMEYPMFVTEGSMQLTDKDGKTVGEAKYMYPTGSVYLEPGEITFIAMEADLEENIEVNVAKNIDVKFNDYRNTDFAVTLENPTYVKATDKYDDDTMRVTVINNSDKPLAGIEAVLVLEDAEGNLLGIYTESLYRYELGPHSSLTMVSAVDRNIRDYCAENGIEPTTVEAFAWVENTDW